MSNHCKYSSLATRSSFITLIILTCIATTSSADELLEQAKQKVTLEKSYVSAARTQRDIFDESDNIASVSGDWLQKLNVQNSKDLTQVFSGLYITNAGGSAYPSITLRGMRSGYYYSPNVRLYIDGVPQDIFFINQELLDVDSVELLKGMSGTLYGENATAGLIIINSNIAQKTPKSSVVANLGTLERGMSANASGEIANNLYAKMSFKHSNFLGQIKDSTTGKKSDTSNSNLFRFSLLYDNALWYLGLDYYLDKSTFADMVYLTDDELNDAQNIVHDYGANGLPSIERTIHTYALKSGFDNERFSLSNVASLQDRKMPITNFGSTWEENNAHIADELKLTQTYLNGSKSLYGLYASFDDYTHRFVKDATRQGDRNHLKTLNFAFFTNHQIMLPANFDLSLGLRYSHYLHSIHYTQGSGTIGDYEDSMSSDHFSPRLALSFTPNDAHKLYASASQGFKAGGYPNLIYNAAYRRPYDKETNYTAEIGYKGILLDDRFYINADYFFTYSQNRQENVLIDPNTNTAIIGNMGNMYSHGVEFEGKYNFANKSFFMLNFAYINAKYHKAINPFTGENSTNREVFFLPALNINASLDALIWDSQSFNVFFNTHISHKSRIYFTDTFAQKPYTLWNLGLRAEMGHLNLSLNVENILNTLYDTYGYSIGQTGYHQIGRLRNINAVAMFRF